MASDYLVVVLENRVEHNFAENSAKVLDLAAFHLHRKSSHGFSRFGIVGWKVVVWHEVIVPVSIQMLNFFHLIGTLMS